MKKLIFILTLMVSTLAFGQEEVPYEALGAWYNAEGEFLEITVDYDGTTVFKRIDSKQILAMGEIKMVEGEMHIKRYDTDSNYNLGFFIGESTMVINKPNSVRGWLWIRLK
jgi:hypothetical protein